MSINATACDLSINATACDCVTKSGKACKKSVFYKFEFIHSETTDVKYSCNLKNHRNLLMKKLPMNSKMNVFKKIKNHFQIIHSELSCLDSVRVFDDVFCQPHTKHHTFWMNFVNLKGAYMAETKMMNTKYSLNKLTSIIQKRDQINDEIEEIRIAYENGSDSLLMKVDSLVTELRKHNNFLNEYMTYYRNTYVVIEKAFHTAKKEYIDACCCVKLPWNEKCEHEECSICLSETCSKEGGYLECGHVFHNDCIKKWIENNKSTCPMCRASFDNNKILDVIEHI